MRLATLLATLTLFAGPMFMVEDGGTGGASCVWRTDGTILVCCYPDGTCWWS